MNEKSFFGYVNFSTSEKNDTIFQFIPLIESIPESIDRTLIGPLYSIGFKMFSWFGSILLPNEKLCNYYFCIS